MKQFSVTTDTPARRAVSHPSRCIALCCTQATVVGRLLQHLQRSACRDEIFTSPEPGTKFQRETPLVLDKLTRISLQKNVR